MSWGIDDIADQSGRTAVVTGSNTGLGFETARALALKGARVVLACRDLQKAQAAQRQILDEAAAAGGAGAVDVLGLDLTDLGAIRAAAAETVERYHRVDLLINNAGVMMPPYRQTADGFELQLGTNHLGHFAYTGLVLERAVATPGARVVTVSSIAHRAGRMRWDDLQWTTRYNRVQAYGQSKLANLLFTFALDRRLRAAGVDTIALAAHPGVSTTELGRYIPGLSTRFARRLGDVAFGFASQPPALGALPTLRAAVDPDAFGGAYYGPGGIREMKGPPVLVQPSGRALQQDDQERLWAVSEELTGVTFPV
jgi:NAD(P)-dependent dehydrogenase (short-subunit alcohol dehydrogenase family)